MRGVFNMVYKDWDKLISTFLFLIPRYETYRCNSNLVGPNIKTKYRVKYQEIALAIDIYKNSYEKK